MNIDLATEVAASLAVRFEGCRLRPYLCPAGVPTIGYGATFYEDGTRVTLFDPPITIELATELLVWMVQHVYLPAAVRLCPGLDTAERVGAITDFAFNLGAGALSASTLRKRINEGLWEDVPDELRKWIKAGGRSLRGLVLRREAEASLI